MNCDGKGFVAVHVGAGYHSPANSELYEKICKQACLQAIQLLRQKKSALEAAKAATIFLEDSPWTNAGTGSNLTMQGTVECDASIMDGQSMQYGAVGALSGVKNPVLVAVSLLETQKQGTMSLGRIPPSTLVGDGARDWAVRNDIPTVKNHALLTDSSRKAFIKHKRKLDMLEEGFLNNHNHKTRKTDSVNLVQTNGSEESVLQDTVGVICVDHSGSVVSAVSSGGIVLKQPGRLGQAALYGCGCWAENNVQEQLGVGISTSGCGEHLTKTLLARECAFCLKNDENPTTALSDTFESKFLRSPYIQSVEQKLGGALAVKVQTTDTCGEMDVEVLWAHTTDSMCVAFMSTESSNPKALISRLPEGKRCGKSYVVQSKCYSIAPS
ncbi:Threonine aspartase 1 [Lamellibrachia satsuma]|nr:Threonine aspartase 1 [Lamellibrachia satsuma]